MLRGRAWHRAGASTREKPLYCPQWEPRSPSRAPMMVEEKAYGVLRPDAAAPEAIRERWRTHRRRGLCGRSVPLPDKVSLYAHNERHSVAIARERRLTRRRYYASLAALRIA